MKRIALTIITVAGGALIAAFVLSNALYGSDSAVIGMWMLFAILGYCFVAAKYNDIFDAEPKADAQAHYAPPPKDTGNSSGRTPIWLETGEKHTILSSRTLPGGGTRRVVLPEDGESMMFQQVPKSQEEE
jgi:hypothetical protein